MCSVLDKLEGAQADCKRAPNVPVKSVQFVVCVSSCVSFRPVRPDLTYHNSPNKWSTCYTLTVFTLSVNKITLVAQPQAPQGSVVVVVVAVVVARRGLLQLLRLLRCS